MCDLLADCKMTAKNDSIAVISMLHVSFWLSNFLLCLFAADFAAPPNVNQFAPAQTTTGPSISKPDTSSNSSLAGLCCENGLKKKNKNINYY